MHDLSTGQVTYYADTAFFSKQWTIKPTLMNNKIEK
jgi:hypothetical protein